MESNLLVVWSPLTLMLSRKFHQISIKVFVYSNFYLITNRFQLLKEKILTIESSQVNSNTKWYIYQYIYNTFLVKSYENYEYMGERDYITCKKNISLIWIWKRKTNHDRDWQHVVGVLLKKGTWQLTWLNGHYSFGSILIVSNFKISELISV